MVSRVVLALFIAVSGRVLAADEPSSGGHVTNAPTAKSLRTIDEDEKYRFVARQLAPFYRNGWNGWKPGTETLVRFLDEKVEGFFSYIQPDLVYRVTDAGLVRTQEVGGKPTEQQLNRGTENQGVFQEAALHQTGEGAPAKLEIDGTTLDCVSYERWAHVDGPNFEGKVHTKEWVLAAQPAIWLRTEQNENYQVIKSLNEPRQVGDRQLSCLVVEKRMTMVGGHALTTEYLSPEVPGHVVETITEIHADGRKQRSHEKMVEMRQPAVTSVLDLPAKELSLIQIGGARRDHVPPFVKPEAVRCEAVTEPETHPARSGVTHVDQKYRLLETIVGRVLTMAGKAGDPPVFTVAYSYLAPPHFNQRAIRKGEQVIWVIEQRARTGNYSGLKALTDTAENRDAVRQTLGDVSQGGVQ